MGNKKRIYVLIIAMLLTLVPQGIYWWYSDELGYIIGIPCFLFRTVTDSVHSGYCADYIFSCDEIINGKLIHMKLETYLYMFLALILIVQCLYQIKTKKEIKAMRWTAMIFMIVAGVQVANSFLYTQITALEADKWKWMSGLSIIRFFIAAGVYVSIVGKEERGVRSSKQTAVSELFYLWLLLISVYDTCFVQINCEQIFKNWKQFTTKMVMEPFNVFFMEPEWKAGTTSDVVFRITVLTVVMVIVAIVFWCIKEEIRLVWNCKLHKVLNVVIVQYLLWIGAVSVFSIQMSHPVRYFMPGIIHVILVSWGCWRVLANDNRKVKSI